MKTNELPKKPTKRQVEAALFHADPSQDADGRKMKLMDDYPCAFSSDMGKAAEILRAHILHERAGKSGKEVAK